MTDVLTPGPALVPPVVSDSAHTGPGRSKVGDEAVVISATGLVALLNYAYTLIILWVLPARAFAVVGSVSAMLLICGTVAGAALPWVLAQEVLRSRHDRARRRVAVTFCLFATVLQGAAAGMVVCAIAYRYAHGPVLIAAFFSVLLIFVGATVCGFYQGLEHFRVIALLKVAEVVVKFGAGVALVVMGAGAGGAIAGYALGAAVVVGVGLVAMAPNVRWSRSALAGRALWASMRGLMAIQAGVAVLASMDVVIGSLVLGGSTSLATYQAANVIGRIPVFIGAGLSVVVFPRMVAGRNRPHQVVGDSARLYLRLAVPVCLMVATMPSAIVDHLFPSRYGDIAAILPWAAVGGLLMGVVNLTTTYFQASGLFRRTTSLLVFGVALGVALDVYGLRLHGVLGLAMAVALGAGVVALALMREVAHTWPGALRGLGWTGATVAVGCLPLLALRGHLSAWLLWAAVCGVVFCLRGVLGAAGSTGGGRPRILHLGYEDPRRPGAGGGSVRTHEINRRLADTFDITVVCARYRGARPRVEDGVRYVHVGIVGGDFPERLAYFVGLPYALLRYRSDLVVEDFGAPFSSVAVPWMTARPTLGVVQWLFAAEKSAQYHLPFAWVERIGVRSHRALIAVSDDLGEQLRERNPRAEVTTVANGLDEGAYRQYHHARSGIAYLGRLENAQKGLDLLLDAYAQIAGTISQDLLLGGDGPDRQSLVDQSERLGVADRVHFVGRVAADDRFAWLASADLVAMPSRYETFGMVAAEALAVGTPVVAFDIPCLRSLVDDGVGRRVPAFDVEAFAEALRELATDGGTRRRLGSAGPGRVAGFNWDRLADHQGQVYRRVLAGTVAAADTSEASSGNPTSNGASEADPHLDDVASRHPDADPRPPDAQGGVAGGGQEPGTWTPRPSGTERPVGTERRGLATTVVGLLARQAALTPQAVAVCDTTGEWTYDELHRAAVAVADALRTKGLRAGDSVGVCLPRSRQAIAAMIGTWAACATYVPLDPGYPPARLHDMIGQAGLSVLIGEPPGTDEVDPVLHLLDPAAIVPADPVGAIDRPRGEPVLEDVAYVLFTSGSTGRPKAVEVTHRSLASVLGWIRSTFSPEELAVATTSISFSFDPFILEVLGPLMMGGTIRAIPSALAIDDVETGCTFLANTPSVLRALVDAGRLPSSLRTVVSGGETLTPSLARDLLGSTSVRRLINTYGPTEATVLATAHEVRLPVGDTVPIGRHLPGAGVVILDGDLREVPVGQTGELCIHGAQVAKGYRGDPEGTAGRFVAVDLGGGVTVRAYRTGDLGRDDGDGVIEFVGRSDRQLKVRGYRIEPGEVEATLCRHPAVSEAVVRASEDSGPADLVAYATTSVTGVTSTELRSWLRSCLPAYLVPNHVVIVDALPVTANGKVDIGSLPSWRLSGAHRSGPTGGSRPTTPPAGVAPRDRVDVVARLVGGLLDIEGPVDPDDDVLDDLGASSLTLFHLLTLMEQEFSCSIEIGRLIEDTTIAGLARLVTPRRGPPGVLLVHEDGHRVPIFMIHAYLGTVLRYRRLGSFLDPDQPLVGIQVQGFEGPTGSTHSTVDQMADEAVVRIRSVRPFGPYLLGGHSAGGLVAYEVARRLAAVGEDVPMVVLIDSPVPRSRLHYLWAELVLNWPDVRSGNRSRRRKLADDAAVDRVDRFGERAAIDRVGSTVLHANRASKRAVRNYNPGPYSGALTVMHTSQGATMALGLHDLGWKEMVTGPLSVIEIPGQHNSIFEPPQVGQVGTRLDSLLDGLATEGRPVSGLDPRNDGACSLPAPPGHRPAHRIRSPLEDVADHRTTELVRHAEEHRQALERLTRKLPHEPGAPGVDEADGVAHEQSGDVDPGRVVAQVASGGLQDGLLACPQPQEAIAPTGGRECRQPPTFVDGEGALQDDGGLPDDLDVDPDRGVGHGDHGHPLSR